MIRYSILLFVLILFLLSCQNIDKSENKVIYNYSDLDCLRSEIKYLDSIPSYAKMLDSIDKYIVKNEMYDSLYRLEDLYVTQPKNAEDSVAMRVQYTKHGQRFNAINDYSEALKYYLKASALASNLRTDKYVWNIENRIGGFYARIDDYDKALYYYTLCIPYLLENEQYGTLSRLYKEIGSTYMWLSHDKEMKAYFDQGITYGTLDKEYRGLQAIHEAYADYYLNNYKDTLLLDHAFSHLNLSQQSLDSLTDDVKYQDRVQSLYTLFGQYYKLNHQASLSYLSYQKALAAALTQYTSPRSREVAKIYAQMASLSLECNELSSLNDYVKKGINKLIPEFQHLEIPNENQIDGENTFVDLLSLKSRYYYLLYDEFNDPTYIDSAMLSLDLAISANDKLNDNILLNHSKYISISTNKSLVSHAIEYCHKAYVQTQKTQYLNKARSYFNQSKSLIYNENQFKNSLREAMSEQDKIQYDITRTSIQTLHKKRETAEGTKNIELEINHLLSELLTIEAKYLPKKSPLKAYDDPYIEYVETDMDYYILTNLGDQLFYKIDNKNRVNAQIHRINQYLYTKNDIRLNLTLDSLSHILLPNDLKLPKNIRIIPDGPLGYLSFDILRKANKYLFEDHVMSVGFHHQVKANKGKTTYQPTIYILNPNYKNPEIPEYASLDRSTLTYLPFAMEEVNKIKTSFDSNYVYDQVVDKKILHEEIKKANIFHFSGHAIVDGDSTYLALTDQSKNIIPVTNTDIFNMTNELDLVTLSACETGLGQYHKGEGVRSLANGFLNCGAKSIVYSLWKADDQSTSELMGLFYTNLALGLEKDEALWTAKKQFLSQCTPAQRHPYYWAAFTVAGDTNSIFNKGISSILFWVGGILLFMILYFLFHFKTKQT